MGERYLARIRSRQVSHDAPGRHPQPAALRHRPPEHRLRPALARPAASATDALADTELLDRVGLVDQADQVVSTMSGGQRQRLALACAVSTAPRLLLADEPTSQLSHADRDHVLHLIHSLGDDFGTTIVVVTHQPEVAATFPRTVTMKGGRVGAEGHGGSEYAVVGEDGVLHLPGHIAAEWPPGTLVRFEDDEQGRIIVTRASARGTRHDLSGFSPARWRPRPRCGSTPSPTSPGARCSTTSASPSPPGKVTALSGPSGSGKTTLLSIAGGLLEPTSGTAELDGQEMWTGSGDPLPEVAFVLQVYGLVPILSARENVSIALRARGTAPADADEAAEAALARFGIADLGERQVEELSGGQMQRVACARGFVVGADVLLADEPTSELDEGNRGVVLAELREEAARGAVVVVATHDPAVVEACDLHIALDEGRVVR